MSKFIVFVFLSYGFIFAHAAKPVCSSKDRSNLAIDQFCNSLSIAAAHCVSDSRCFWSQNGKKSCSSKDTNNLAKHQFCNSLTNAGIVTCNLQSDCFWSN
jgi:hypothetical protein